MTLTQLNPKTYIRNLLSFSIHSNLAQVALPLVCWPWAAGHSKVAENTIIRNKTVGIRDPQAWTLCKSPYFQIKMESLQ